MVYCSYVCCGNDDSCGSVCGSYGCSGSSGVSSSDCCSGSGRWWCE